MPTAENVVKLNPLTGLYSGNVPPKKTNEVTANANADTPKTWLIRADHFQFATNCPIPITELYIGDETTPQKGSPLNIKPMQETGLTSKQTLKIIYKATNKNVLDSTWTVVPVKNNVPTALWGTGDPKKLSNGTQLVENQFGGFNVTVPPPSLGAGTGEISIREDLQYDPLPPGKNPLGLGQSPVGPIPTQSDTTIANIGQIMSTGIKNKRDAIYQSFRALNLEDLNNGDLTNLSTNAGALFTNEPLLI